MRLHDHPLLKLARGERLSPLPPGPRRITMKTPADMRAESIRMWGDVSEPKPDARGLSDWGESIKHAFAARDRKVEAWVTEILTANGIDPADLRTIRHRCQLVQRDPQPHILDSEDETHDPGEMWIEIDGKRVGSTLNYHGEEMP